MATTTVSAPGLSAGPISVHDADPNTERAAKKAKLEPQTIGTHNGTFHCDEALAVFLLRQTNKYKDAGTSHVALCLMAQLQDLTPAYLCARSIAH